MTNRPDFSPTQFKIPTASRDSCCSGAAVVNNVEQRVPCTHGFHLNIPNIKGV